MDLFTTMNSPSDPFTGFHHTNISNSNTSITDSKLYSDLFATSCYVTYLMLLVIGLGTNLFSIAAMVTDRSTMQSLHLYTLNLVVCDVLLLLTHVPTQMVLLNNSHSDWWRGAGLCKVADTAVSVLLCCTMVTLLGR